MHFNSARQAWHDAFAIQQRTFDSGEGRGGKYNNDSQIVNGLEAGKVIAVVDALRPVPKSFGMLCYSTVSTRKDEERVLDYMFREYHNKFGSDELTTNRKKMARFLILLNCTLNQVKALEMNGRSVYTQNDLAKAVKVHSSQFQRDIGPLYENLKQILDPLPGRALGPVAKLVAIEKEKRAA